jgi:putative ATP-dependent endonuclease of OLD family
MYLSNMHLKNLRGIKDLKLEFRPGLNVIVGENNAGKTTVIDAIRMVLGRGGERRDLFLTEDDFFQAAGDTEPEQTCEIHITFRGLNVHERGYFSQWLAPSLGPDIAQVHMKGYWLQQGSRKVIRTSFWGGEKETQTASPELFEYFSVVYLAALRDVRFGLRPGRESRVGRLVKALSTGKQEQERLEGILAEANNQILRDPLITRTKTEINERLNDVTGGVFAQSTDLAFSPPKFSRMVESLRILLSGTQFEIDLNGLGYNNLLYIAAVLGELQQSKAAEDVVLPILLIEEPEAHLHPHLQTILMDYLEKVSMGQPEANRKAITEDVHSGEHIDSKSELQHVQVFCTTHSPTLASRVDPDCVNVLFLDRATRVSAFPVIHAQLTSTDKADLRRYLDVTKAQLFFAKGVILVEGISEALLLPELARIIGLDLDRRLISVVNVQGLSFRPFALLFNQGKFGIPAAIVADSDPPKASYPAELNMGTASGYAQNLSRLEGGTLRVFFASKTLEYDLALARNAARMAAEYQKIHPQKGAELLDAINAATDDNEKARIFFQGFDRRDKARFAQILARSLKDRPDEFKVPEYIKNAFYHVTGAQEPL